MHVLIRLNVSLVIRLYFICKHAGIRDHTDESKQSEQSVFRIGFYLCKFSRLHILHSHRLKQSVAAHFFDYRIPQKCDLRIGKCFLLNRLCCTQLVSSVNDRNFSGKFCKIQRFFHRCIPGFMIQGGGFEKGMKQKPTNAPIENEAANGLKNNKYTIAMARTQDPHSATAQFFINVANNDFLNHTAPTPQGWGYAVFGKVVAGQDVVDQIAKVRTGMVSFYGDVPVEDVVIEKAEII